MFAVCRTGVVTHIWGKNKKQKTTKQIKPKCMPARKKVACLPSPNPCRGSEFEPSGGGAICFLPDAWSALMHGGKR